MDPTQIDPELIYAKTASGEEAMQQRTRVVQRNVRMVLILVDGNATVAELCNRTGNAQLTQNALFELENDGFIERRTEKNSVWVRSGKPGRQAAPPPQPTSGFSRFGGNDESALVQSVPPGKGERLIRASQISLSPPSSTRDPALTGPESGTVFLAREAIAAESPVTPSASAKPQGPSLLARLKARARVRNEEDQPELKPIRHSGRKANLTWPLVVMLGVLLLSALVFLTAMWFPYAIYLPEVEAVLAQSTGEAAKVDDMRVTFYPRPGLLLSQVRLGDENDGNPVRIGRLRLQPVLSTLLSSRLLLREVELGGVSLSAEAIARLSRMLESVTRRASGPGVLHIALDNAEISFAGLGVGEMRGEMGLSAEGLLQSVSLHSPDRNLQVEAKPMVGGLAVQIEGLGWHPSPKSAYLFDSLTIKGEILGPAFTIDGIELRIFGGLVQGAAVLRAERQAAMSGEISFERIDARRLGEALAIGGQFEGETAGRLRFSATAENWPTLFSALHADGEFTMKRGALGGIDLPEAVRRVSATPATLGGATRFEQLSGALRFTPGNYRFSRLVLNAGLMQSTGQLEVDRDLQLRGRMDVQMRGRPDHTAKPVSISGPLKSPQLQVPGPS